jgi:hypothetical protein
MVLNGIAPVVIASELKLPTPLLIVTDPSTPPVMLRELPTYVLICWADALTDEED